MASDVRTPVLHCLLTSTIVQLTRGVRGFASTVQRTAEERFPKYILNAPATEVSTLITRSGNSVRTAAGYEAYNANYVGGDINAGAGTFWQTVARPVPRWNPYRTPARRGRFLLCAVPRLRSRERLPFVPSHWVARLLKPATLKPATPCEIEYHRRHSASLHLSVTEREP